jgi:hypothetical protein
VSNVIEFPTRVVGRTVMEKLIDAGYLRPDQRHSADAVRAALDHLSAFSAEWSKSGPYSEATARLRPVRRDGL